MTLKSTLATLPQRLSPPSNAERMRGRAAVTRRQRIMVRDLCTCADCGRVTMDGEADHDTPLHMGGALAALLAAWRVQLYLTRNGNDVVTEIPIGMTLPGPLTKVGTPWLPFANVYDHSIGRVVDALAVPAAA